jgi:hypothetical protein
MPRPTALLLGSILTDREKNRKPYLDSQVFLPNLEFVDLMLC